MPGEEEKGKAYGQLIRFCAKYKGRLDAGDAELIRRRESLIENCRQVADSYKDWGGG